MMTDEDFDFLEKVYDKLRSAKVMGSSVRLNSAEIKIILKNQEDLMAMVDDMFGEEDDKQVCQVIRIMNCWIKYLLS